MCYDKNNRPDFTSAPVDTSVYSPAFGFGKILPKREGSFKMEPIAVMFESGVSQSFTSDGRLRAHSELECILFYVNGTDRFSKVPPLPEIDPSKIPVDTEVLVWDSGYDVPGIPRKYSGHNKVFANGRCLFTWDAASLEEWDVFKLAEAVTIDSVEYPIGYTWRAE